MALNEHTQEGLLTTAPPFEGSLVPWRLAHGSHCSLCPLNGQRKVGCSGPLDADHILIGEAPGKDEEEYRSGVDRYGEPFVGKSGFMAKAFLFAPAGHTTIAQRPGQKWPRILRQNAFLMNIAMCRPPKNKITSPQGRRAVAACRDSAVALVKELFARKPSRAIQTLGATSLDVLTGTDKVGQQRGRPRKIRIDLLEVRGFEAAAKVCLRGQKPWKQFPDRFDEENWKLFEKVLRGILAAHRRSVAKVNAPPKAPKPRAPRKVRVKKEKA